MRLLQTFTLLVPLGTTAFAAVPPTVSPLGSGYREGTATINGKDYAATFSLAGSTTAGGYSQFTTQARCARAHNTVTVVFNTQSSGYETYSGGARSVSASTGTSVSHHVYYNGSDTPIGIRQIAGSLTATVTNQDGTTKSFPFSASA